MSWLEYCVSFLWCLECVHWLSEFGMSRSTVSDVKNSDSWTYHCQTSVDQLCDRRWTNIIYVYSRIIIMTPSRGCLIRIECFRADNSHIIHTYLTHFTRRGNFRMIYNSVVNTFCNYSWSDSIRKTYDGQFLITSFWRYSDYHDDGMMTSSMTLMTSSMYNDIMNDDVIIYKMSSCKMALSCMMT